MTGLPPTPVGHQACALPFSKGVPRGSRPVSSPDAAAGSAPPDPMTSARPEDRTPRYDFGPMTQDDDARLRAERDLYRRLLDLGASEDVESFLKEALALLTTATGAREGYLQIADPAAPGTVRFWTAHALGDEDVERARTSVSRGIVAEALASGRTVQSAKASEDPRFRDRASVLDLRIEAVLCVPIGGPPPFGVAYLQSRERPGPFDPEDIARAEVVARGLAAPA